MFLPMDVEAQCAMCKASTESARANASNIGNGLNKGILFLMAIPYLFILVIPMILFRKQIKSFFKELRDVHK